MEQCIVDARPGGEQHVHGCRSKGIGMSHARANVSAVGILGFQAAFRPGRMSIQSSFLRLEVLVVGFDKGLDVVGHTEKS